MRRVALACLSLAGQVLIAASSGHALPLVNMEDALAGSAPTISNLQWLGSSDELLASVRQAPDAAPALTLWRIADGTAKAVGVGEYPSADPGGRRVIFLHEQQWKVLSLAEGRVDGLGRKLTARPTLTPRWSRDGRYVAILETIPPARQAHADAAASSGVQVIDLGAAADARRNTDNVYGEAQLRLVDVKSQRQIVIKSPGEFVYYGDWGARHEFYFVALQLNWGGGRAHTALRRVEPENPVPQEIYRIDDAFLQSAAPVVSPDGRFIALSVDVDNKRREDFLSLIVLDTQSLTLQRLTSDLSVSHGVGPGSYEWTPDGRALIFSARSGGLDQIHRVDLKGRVTSASQGERFHFGPRVSSSGRWIAYETRDGYGRNDIRVRSLKTSQERIVAALRDPARRFRLGEFRRVKWPSTDGLSIRGYLILPPDFDPERPYPLYVDVHGGGPGISLVPAGPLSVTPTALEWHAWAALGYVVFVPDMRSSGEYGPQIAAARYREKSWDATWGIVKDAEDVNAGVRWLLEQGFIDRERIALFGHSAGGGRANYLLATTPWYSAGILDDPIPAGSLPHLIGLTSGANTGLGFDETSITYGLRFKEDPALYTGGFLFDGYRYTAPTLILVGNPERGALEPLSAEILFSMLRQYKIPTRMLRYSDDGHTPSTVDSALHRFREIKRWLETHIPVKASAP